MGECRSCGRQHPPDARFCAFCGVPLGESSSDRREERRRISVLFADLVGFTARSDGADPEDVQATLGPFHSAVKREVERFGGTIEKFIGDAVVAVFGVPHVREDDAERAVRAALAVVEAVGRLNETEAGLDLAVRIAVDTGEALVALGLRPEEGAAFLAGDVVNTASRLQQVASVNTVVVGEATRRATKGVVSYTTLDPAVVKGKADPIPIWRAVGAEAAGRTRATAMRGGALVGRLPELALLNDAFVRAARGRHAHLVTLTGDPGVGKSRLLAEFLARLEGADETFGWLQGGCLPYGEGVTFWAFSEVIKASAQIADSDSPRDAAAKLERSVAKVAKDGHELRWFVDRLAPLVGVAASEEVLAGDREDTFQVWRSFVEALANERPLVLVFENLQWADSAMVEFVTYLVRSATGAPLLVACTARPEFLDRAPLWAGGVRNATAIALQPLTDAETGRLIAQLLEGAVLPTMTEAQLLERVRGNPLYVEEFVRLLVDAGLLERRGARGVLAELADLPVPETVQATIAARLDTLPPAWKTLLKAAAVIGETFWVGALTDIGDLDERAVREGLRELAHKELVHPVARSSISGEAEYVFAHSLVRDVAYGQIPRAERAEKHRAAAHWLERVQGPRITEAAEHVAHHYVAALELARAVGTAHDAAELEASARRLLGMAGDRAVRLDAQAAASYYQQALALTPPGHPERPRLLVKTGEAAHQSGHLTDAESAYEEAVSEFREQGDDLGGGETLVRLSRLLWWRGRTARGHQVLTEAVGLLERRPPSPALALACARMAGDHACAGRFAEALPWSERALDLARELGLDDVEVRALQYRGLARCEAGDLDGLDDLRTALDRGLDLGLGHETATAYDNLGDWVWLTEGPERGLAVNREGVAFAERLGQTETATWTKAETLWMLFDAGSWDELLQVAGEVITWDRRHGGNQVGVIASTHRALVFAWRGELAAAGEQLETQLGPAREIGDPDVLVPALATAALVAVENGDHGRGIGMLRELSEATLDKPLWRARDLPTALWLCARTGAIELGARLLEGAADAPRRARLCRITGTALLDEAGGRHEDALVAFRDAAEGWRRFGAPVFRALAQLGEARCLEHLGHAGDDARQEARGIAAVLGAEVLAAGLAPSAEQRG